MPHKKELLYQPARELRAQTSPDGSRIISGYAVRYNELSSDLGGFKELVAVGAVTESLKNNPDVMCLWSHDTRAVLGRTKSKTLTLTEDAQGLRFSCVLPPNSQGSDLAVSIDRGDVDGVSFGFVCDEDTWAADESGNVIRTLVAVSIFEVSPCIFPAYPTTSVRSCPPELRSLIRSQLDDEGDECTCEKDSDGNHIDPECHCDDDEDDDEDRNKPLTWSERMLLQLDVARRK
jgi:HK97 family phage prohead protease